MYSSNFPEQRTKIFTLLETSTVGKVLQAFLFAFLTGLLALIKIPLPWTPVPITGQTIAVISAGLIIGKFWGSLSQILYIFLGTTCFHWFATGKVEFFTFLSPTMGYLIGFVFAAYFSGYAFDYFSKADKNAQWKPVLTLIGIHLFVIYLPGILVLESWKIFLTEGQWRSFQNILMMGVLPFIPGDILKILISIQLAFGIRNKSTMSQVL